MKKTGFAILLVITLLLTVSCGKKADQAAAEPIRVAMLKGPSGMGAAYLMGENVGGKSKNKYEFSLFGAPEDVAAKITNGEIDIAAVPANLAAVLYNKLDKGVKIAAYSTLGVLYIVENGEAITSLDDLRGKTLYATGKGAMPEFVLNYILVQNGIDPAKDLTIEYKTEHSELAALMASGDVTLAMLPEPFVTTAMMNNADLRVALNLTDEWDKAAELAGSPGCVLAQTVILVREEFLKDNKAVFNAFLDEYKKSVEYANNNTDETAALIESYGILEKSAVAKKALPNCNLVYVEGQPMIDTIKNLLEVLFAAEPKSVGGALPDDGFYYKR